MCVLASIITWLPVHTSYNLSIAENGRSRMKYNLLIKTNLHFQTLSLTKYANNFSVLASPQKM